MIVLGYVSMLFVGLSLGLMGGGGSILTVPILVYLFSVSPATATGYSLFIVGIVSLIGVFRYFQKNEINLNRGVAFALPGLAGIWLSRAIIVPSLPESIITISGITITKDLLIMIIFAALMVLASVSMIRGRKESAAKDANLLFLACLGFIVSVVTGFVGAGGGFLIVPSLALLGGLNMRAAVATSLFVITINSLFGFATDLLSESYQVKWEMLIGASIVALVGLFVGIKFSDKVSEKVLKKAFGIFVLVTGSSILVQQILSGG